MAQKSPSPFLIYIIMKYLSNIKRLSISVKVGDNKERKISFEPIPASCYGHFYTNNQEICDALEKHPKNGILFFAEKKATIEKKEVANIKEYPDITRTQEVIKVLVEKYGVENGTIKTRVEALKKAALLNISFPNLK